MGWRAITISAKISRILNRETHEKMGESRLAAMTGKSFLLRLQFYQGADVPCRLPWLAHIDLS